MKRIYIAVDVDEGTDIFRLLDSLIEDEEWPMFSSERNLTIYGGMDTLAEDLGLVSRHDAKEKLILVPGSSEVEKGLTDLMKYLSSGSSRDKFINAVLDAAREYQEAQ